MKKDKDLTLMDRVHEFLFEKNLNGRPLPDGCRDVNLKQRVELRRAERFTLDDDAVRLICHLSHEQERLPSWALLARLPHRPMWVEFNLHTKVREFEAMGTLQSPFDPADVAEKCGYLMYPDNPDPESTDPRWTCHEYGCGGGMKGMETFAGMLAYVYDPEGDGKFPTRGSKRWRSPTLSLRENFPKTYIKLERGPLEAPLVAPCDIEVTLSGLYDFNAKIPAGTRIGPRGEMVLDEPMVHGPEWLMQRFACTVDPWWEAWLLHYYGQDKKKINTAIGEQARESRGHIKWIITMLAAINGLPKTIKPANTRTSKRSVGMYQLPYFGHSNISITIPRENRTMRARKILDRESNHARRRRHGVMGHWRIVEYGKMKYFCRHDPTLVESGLAICKRCELLVRWIPDHERGDATLGLVRHEYRVTT